MRPELVKAIASRASNVPATSELSPLVRYLSQTAGYGAPDGLGAALPRDAREFWEGATFSPLNPIAPLPINAPSPSGRAEPRRFAYPMGANLPSAPGSTKLIDFGTLRTLADLHDVTRKCIELRKQEIADLEWEITVRAPNKKLARQMLDATDVQARIEKVTEFLERPDPIAGRTYKSWVKIALEDVFVVDALSIYLHPTWGADAGLLTEDRVAALEILDGTTIKPLLSARGARPMPPNPAYQQFLYGFPRSEFTAVDESRIDGGREAQPVPAAQLAALGIRTSFSTDQLIYKPYVERSWTPYGLPPTEQIIVAINLALKREQWHLAYFTDSTVPAGLIHAPEEWTPKQIEEYQGWFDSLLAGDPSWKHRIRVVPGTEKFEQLKPPAHDIEFDEFLVRVVCLGFDVSPQEVGFPPRGQGLGGSGAAANQIESSKRRSIGPVSGWLKSEVFDRVIRSQFDPGLQIKFKGLEEDDDPELSTVELKRMGQALLTINQWRVDHDLDPFSEPEAEKPFFLTTAGPVFLEGALDRAKQQLDQASEMHDATVKKTKAEAENPGAAGSGGAPFARKAALVDELFAWRRKALRAVKAGRPADVAFERETIDDELATEIKAELVKADSADKVRAAFGEIDERAARRERNDHPAWLTQSGDALELALRGVAKETYSRKIDAMLGDESSPLPSTADARKVVELIERTRTELATGVERMIVASTGKAAAPAAAPAPSEVHLHIDDGAIRVEPHIDSRPDVRLEIPQPTRITRRTQFDPHDVERPIGETETREYGP